MSPQPMGINPQFGLSATNAIPVQRVTGNELLNWGSRFRGIWIPLDICRLPGWCTSFPSVGTALRRRDVIELSSPLGRMSRS